MRPRPTIPTPIGVNEDSSRTTAGYRCIRRNTLHMIPVCHNPCPPQDASVEERKDFLLVQLKRCAGALWVREDRNREHAIVRGAGKA